MRTNRRFIYDAGSSIGKADCPNILIKGNNIEVLPELVSEYGGKVKCVYIDPPYNNGDRYIYYNDKVSEVNWLRDIRNVLEYLKILLSKDGSVWISIDDSEMAYLKIEADKVFGRENFAGTIVWQQRKTRENRAVFSCNHEYILVYAKDIKKFKKSRNLLPVGEGFIDSKYKNPDNDSRGPWQSVSASVQAGHAVASQFYTIISPTGKEHYPPKGRCWVYNEERMKNEIAQGNIWFGKDGLNAPRIKKFLSSAKLGLTPQTLWTGDEYGSTDSAKKQLLSMFPNEDNVFDTPKPEELIMQILNIATNQGDLVLDCYLGSGTTLAVAHKLRRRYIGIEVGDHTTELVLNRLKGVVNGDGGGISQTVDWHGGGEFAFFCLDGKIEKRGGSEFSKAVKTSKKVRYHQLDLFSLLEEYGGEPILENDIVSERDSMWYQPKSKDGNIDMSKNVLVSLVKKDNENAFLDGSASIYYTGKKFPSTVTLNKLYYFMPYFKGKGIRDLYVIRIVRIGHRREGQPDGNDKDIRLVFEINFVKQLFNDYKPIELKIWRSFTDTTMGQLLNE